MKDVLSKTSNLPLIVKSSFGIKHFTEDEISRLTRTFESWYEERPTSRRARYYLVFLFLRFTGARISEVINVDEKRDLDFRRGEVRLKNLKKTKHKNTYRIVPVPDKLIAEYLRLTHVHRDIEGKALKVQRTNFFVKFRELCKRAGISEELAHPHVLRHTRAIELVRYGLPLTVVKAILGHSNLNTTAVYLEYSATEIREIMKLKGVI